VPVLCPNLKSDAVTSSIYEIPSRNEARLLKPIESQRVSHSDDRPIPSCAALAATILEGPREHHACASIDIWTTFRARPERLRLVCSGE
jgi:hypothetical protein